MTIYERTHTAIQASGVASYYLVAKPTALRPEVPSTYAVYRRLLSNNAVSGDDRDIINAHYVRIDVYSDTDPTDAVVAVRASLEATGYLIRDERDATESEGDGYHVVLSTVYHEEVL